MNSFELLVKCACRPGSKLLTLSGKLKMAEKTREDAQGGIDRLKEFKCD